MLNILNFWHEILNSFGSWETYFKMLETFVTCFSWDPAEPVWDDVEHKGYYKEPDLWLVFLWNISASTIAVFLTISLVIFPFFYTLAAFIYIWLVWRALGVSTGNCRSELWYAFRVKLDSVVILYVWIPVYLSIFLTAFISFPVWVRFLLMWLFKYNLPYSTVASVLFVFGLVKFILDNWPVFKAIKTQDPEWVEARDDFLKFTKTKWLARLSVSENLYHPFNKRNGWEEIMRPDPIKGMGHEKKDTTLRYREAFVRASGYTQADFPGFLKYVESDFDTFYDFNDVVTLYDVETPALLSTDVTTYDNDFMWDCFTSLFPNNFEELKEQVLAIYPISYYPFWFPEIPVRTERYSLNYGSEHLYARTISMFAKSDSVIRHQDFTYDQLQESDRRTVWNFKIKQFRADIQAFFLEIKLNLKDMENQNIHNISFQMALTVLNNYIFFFKQLYTDFFNKKRFVTNKIKRWFKDIFISIFNIRKDSFLQIFIPVVDLLKYRMMLIVFMNNKFRRILTFLFQSLPTVEYLVRAFVAIINFTITGTCYWFSWTVTRVATFSKNSFTKTILYLQNCWMSLLYEIVYWPYYNRDTEQKKYLNKIQITFFQWSVQQKALKTKQMRLNEKKLYLKVIRLDNKMNRLCSTLFQQLEHTKTLLRVHEQDKTLCNDLKHKYLNQYEQKIELWVRKLLKLPTPFEVLKRKERIKFIENQLQIEKRQANVSKWWYPLSRELKQNLLKHAPIIKGHYKELLYSLNWFWEVYTWRLENIANFESNIKNFSTINPFYNVKNILINHLWPAIKMFWYTSEGIIFVWIEREIKTFEIWFIKVKIPRIEARINEEIDDLTLFLKVGEIEYFEILEERAEVKRVAEIEEKQKRLDEFLRSRSF